MRRSSLYEYIDRIIHVLERYPDGVNKHSRVPRSTVMFRDPSGETVGTYIDDRAESIRSLDRNGLERDYAVRFKGTFEAEDGSVVPIFDFELAE